MNLHPEDPRLTAYVLGELAPEDAAAVQSAVAGDPALQAEVAEIRAIQRLLTDRLALPQESLLPRQRENVRRSARQAGFAGKALPFSRMANSLKPWLIPTAAAAVLAIATFILLRMPDPTPAPIASQAPAPLSNAPVPETPAAPVVDAPEPPPSLPRGPVVTADSPKLDLPVITAQSNLQTISQSIRGDGKLPAPESVRLEEILNSFPLRLNGVTAIARGPASGWHPDTRDAGMSVHLATLSTEMLACPWKPSATLLLISLRGNAQQDTQVKMAFHPNLENVARYRLLGFTSAGGSGKLPATLAANEVTTLAIEIEPSQPGTDFGSLEWTTDDQPAPAISLVHKLDSEPSNDARFAALACTFGQWLAGEQAGIIDADIVAALARENAAADLPADRADFLGLIDRSLNL